MGRIGQVRGGGNRPLLKYLRLPLLKYLRLQAPLHGWQPATEKVAHALKQEQVRGSRLKPQQQKAWQQARVAVKALTAATLYSCRRWNKAMVWLVGDSGCPTAGLEQKFPDNKKGKQILLKRQLLEHSKRAALKRTEECCCPCRCRLHAATPSLSGIVEFGLRTQLEAHFCKPPEPRCSSEPRSRARSTLTSVGSRRQTHPMSVCHLDWDQANHRVSFAIHGTCLPL